MSDFFREEVLERRSDDIGVPLHITTLWMRVYAVLLTIVVVAIVAGIILFSYSQKAVVTGFLLPSGGLVRIFTPQDGRIIERRVSEGQQVEKDEVLLLVDVGAETVAGRAASLAQDTIRERSSLILAELERLDTIHDVQRDELLSKITLTEEQIQLMEAEEQEKLTMLALSQRALDRRETLHARGAISPAQRDEAEQDYVASSLDLLAQQRALSERRQELVELQSRWHGLASDQENEKSRLRRELAALEEEMSLLADRQTILIRSPAAGTITGITVSVGSTVINDGIPILTLIPADSQMEAVLYAPSSAVGFIQKGDSVTLRYEAFPHQKFGVYHARVSTISQTSVSTSELPYEVVSNEPLYVITAALESETIRVSNQEVPLQAGAKFEAHLVLEERHLWEWILGPVLGAQAS